MGVSKCLFKVTLRYMGAKRLFRHALENWETELNNELIETLGNVVRTGPFEGMILPDRITWGSGERVAKVLGCYESELHSHLLQAVRNDPATVVNVGCAEGFYAVGLARLLPKSAIFAFDIDETAQAVCFHAAKLNGVGDRVTTAGRCTPEILDGLAGRDGGVLIVMDCEGGEETLLDPAVAPALAGCDIIVEVHDFDVVDLVDQLEKRLGDTHIVERISQGARNPHCVPELAHRAEIDRWLAVCESRPTSMTWLACWTKQQGKQTSAA